MNNNYLSQEKRNIKTLIEKLSKTLNVDVNKLSFLEKKLDTIILNKTNNSLEDMLENYFTLLEDDMVTIMSKKITPAVQFGIQNKYFTFIGYDGNFNSLPNSININEHTYFSFDSISKILTSIITMMMIRDGKVSLNSTINSYNPNFNMDASIESILKFTAMIQTEKRIDNLPKEETIEILKRCRENIIEKNKLKNYYQYNDIGYMILRLSIPDFLERLDTILNIIDKNNLTYKNIEKKNIITGGRLGLEYFTPDTKGRNIPFPGHAGLYGNIEGLLNLFNQTFYTNNIITKEELEILLTQPYQDPYIYDKNGNKAISKSGNNQYIAKIAGVYRKPKNIYDENFNKIASCDFSNLTTNNALASAGTCGSWVVGDNLSNQGLFGSYTGGILTNPYSSINIGNYPNYQNNIPNTNLIVNQKGVIIGYPKELNDYKNIITEYGLLLELLTEYLKEKKLIIEPQKQTYIRKLKKTH